MKIHETLGEITKRYRESPVAVKVGGVLLPMAIVIPGCGGSSSELSDCPSSEYHRDHASVPAKMFNRIQNGIDTLRTRVTGVDSSPAPSHIATESLDPSAIHPRYVDAARAVFHMRGGKLQVGSSETRLDDRDEVLCEGNGNELFLTGEAESAMSELSLAGIDTTSQPFQDGSGR